MKVVELQVEKKKCSELKRGDVFLYNLKYYMVTNKQKSQSINVVELETGFLETFHEETEVCPVEAEVVIK